MKQLLQGDALEVLRTLPSDSVQCCITSPPYWGLRDYGIAGQYGLEPTPELYISKMVEVFHEVKRVLRKDGTLWLNMGDCYGRAPEKGGSRNGYGEGYEEAQRVKSESQGSSDGFVGRGDRAPVRNNSAGIKAKDLIGIPWLLAFALRADGWYLRMDIIWSKKNPMPESVTDRPTKAHEYVFLLSKSERYYYDAEAIKEEVTGVAHPRGNGVNPKATKHGQHSRIQVDRDPRHLLYPKRPRQNESFSGAVNQLVSSRNKRSVWEIATAPYPGSHFATFPPDLVKPCILAGTSEKGCCSECGAPWERIVERDCENLRPNSRLPDQQFPSEIGAGHTNGQGDSTLSHAIITKTLGWQPTCKCCALAMDETECAKPAPYPTKRCVVLDPFAGSGTVGLVAQLNHCDFIGIELNPEYILLAEKRLAQEALQF